MKSDNHIKVNALLNGIKEPVLLIDPQAQIILKANKPARMVFGNDETEKLAGQSLQTLYDGTIFSFTESIIINGARNGRKIKLDFRLSTLKINDQEVVLAIGREIEKQQTLKEKLNLLKQEKAVQEMKANFISMTSHEFRTPLTAISSSVDLLETKLKMDELMNAFYQHNITKISTELFNLTNMLDEILTLSKIVSDNYAVIKSEVNAEEVVNYLREQYFSERKDGRTLQVKSTGTPRDIYVDKNQLSKILTNLISNAFKFSTKGDPSIKLNYQEKKLVVKVCDTGIGIPAKDLPNLFSSFYRASNADNIEGTGLGLVIVKTFVECNNGTISVDSEKDKGTTFTLGFKYRH
ncbi:ATP-binding protein [uncultured Chitinophaga sp.]|uniref:sensor histidine kinase n=1 Tax=uncultured Chitinophaga sp. TaxID=339340 RepID=UPI0025DA2E72|nr:ATP-binding protein [uncultured Chitinophaga sp.]